MNDVPTPHAIAVDAIEAHRLVEETGALLLDVREPDEWRAGHAPDAHHLPAREVCATVLPSTHLVITVCRSGGRRSTTVAEHLRADGIHALTLTGGMQAWVAEGLPVITDSGAPGSVE
jgi:rhodanese-related sulfurtransferase